MKDLCACEVDDKVKLALFIHKRDEWRRWIVGNGPHAVQRQVMQMLWNDAIFRTFNEGRRLTTERKSKRYGLNGPLMRLLDYGFVSSQTMSIRRLTDRNFRDPEKAVISLVRAIDDIRENIDLITRENYLCHDGTSYVVPNHAEDLNGWVKWKTKQANFDKLSETKHDKRDRLDKMQKSVLNRLDQELKVCGSIRKYVNKFIAHASDPQTNPELTEEEKKITFDKLDTCYIAIVRVASFLGVQFLYEHSISDVPTPQYDQLKNLDVPMVARADMDKVYSFWAERCREVHTWGNWSE
jgi:hypothetical protein